MKEIFELLGQIKVSHPGGLPSCNDIVETCKKLGSLGASVVEAEKITIQKMLFEHYSDFELRSLFSRCTTMCEDAIEHNDESSLYSAVFLYEIVCARIDKRVRLITDRIMFYTTTLLRLGVDDIRSRYHFSDCFCEAMEKLLELEDVERDISYVGLEIGREFGKPRFRPCK